MSLVWIPEEVIQANILPFLEWNDFLRLRRVCHYIKFVVDNYIKSKPELTPEIEINEEDKTIEALLKTNILTCRIFINNTSGAQFYTKEKSKFAKFFRRFAPRVTHLRVKQLNIYLCYEEWDFLSALPNLQHFEAGYFGIGVNFDSYEELCLKNNSQMALARTDRRYVSSNPPLPQNFRNLKSFKIGQLHGKASLLTITSCLDGILKIGKDLEYISAPYVPFWKSFDDHPSLTLGMAFLTIQEEVSMRKKIDRHKLKIVDFYNYHSNPVSIREVMDAGTPSRPHILSMFLHCCAEHEIQIANAASSWFTEYIACSENAHLGSVVLSLVNITFYALKMHMHNLESVDIRATSECFIGNFQMQLRPEWPKLERLKVSIDSKDSNTLKLFRLLFQGIERFSLNELCLKFDTSNYEWSIPKCDEIVSSCVNLKRLRLVHWPGTNKSLIKLWTNLLNLEEVTLECCPNLGNVAFVGLDTSNPVFFNLKKLKRLSLKGLDEMPKITDLLFSMVIKNLSLTHFVLTSASPLQNITLAGIKSLSDGCFAETIERFPFDNWSLQNVSTAEFSKLEKSFRSFYMI